MTDGSSNADSAPKIVIDSDWKSQAQAEKERLAAAERSKAPMSRSAGDPAVPQEGDGEGLPEANFKALIGTLITNALMYLGAFPDPQSGRAMVAPEYAKFHIDLLGVLQEKTKGNLTEEEQRTSTIRSASCVCSSWSNAGGNGVAMKSEAATGEVCLGAGSGGAVDVAKVGPVAGAMRT